MRYGDGVVVLLDGVPVYDRKSPYAFPATRGFQYPDGAYGDFLLENFTIKYTNPRTHKTYIITVLGNSNPRIGTAFDFDFASIDARLFRALTCDKADYRIRVASLFHDILFCVHDPAFPLKQTNLLLYDIMSAYSDGSIADAWLRDKVFSAVEVGGWKYWPKTVAELNTYRSMFKCEELTQ